MSMSRHGLIQAIGVLRHKALKGHLTTLGPEMALEIADELEGILAEYNRLMTPVQPSVELPVERPEVSEEVAA